ncbi:MAG: T9SS type A sorting domain-containing protein [Bernardetiaceae bacterium]|nr:T9SS type A sorting domain-containing protein [Bernardetiaceae bacterium]
MKYILLFFFVIASYFFVTEAQGQNYNITNGTVNTCSGNFFDSGGPSGNYSNNEDFTFTICPDVPGSLIEVDFTAFDVETSGTCAFDRLIIYDGNDATASQIGTYCGTNSPGTVTATNLSGCLTFRFQSDGSVTRPGWTATISCISTCPAEGGTAEISNNLVCSGSAVELSLTDYTGNTIQWQASTDDGTTFVDIPGATTPTVTVNPTVNTIYLALVTATDCPNPGDTQTTNSTTTSVTIQDCFNMPSGTNTVNTCGALFYDSGGPNNDYGNNENRTFTICPDDPASFLEVNFTDFSTENCCDNLRIFDGPDISSPLIGQYQGTTSPGLVTSSTAGGCLTFRFQSDGSVTRPGWEAVVSCTRGCPIITNLNITNCSGTAPNPTIFDISFDVVHNYDPGDGTFSVFFNGTPYGSTAYATSPQTYSTSAQNNLNSLALRIVDNIDPDCAANLTWLVNAGSDAQGNACSGTADLAAFNPPAGATGSWSFISGPATPTIGTPTANATNVTGMDTEGDYLFEWAVDYGGGCVLRDRATITIGECLNMESPDQASICSGGLVSHPAYDGVSNNSPTSYNQTITLCPADGQAIQLTFENVDLNSATISVWYQDGTAGTADLVINAAGFNGRTFTLASNSPDGCMTLRYVTANQNNRRHPGFLANITCRPPLTPSPNCAQAQPLCADGNTFFPTASGGTNADPDNTDGGTNFGCLSSGERGSTWFYLQAAETGTLEFDIKPIVRTDDYDFGLWGPFNVNSVADIPCGPGLGAPIRCNYSGSTTAAGAGWTGISATSTHPAYSPALDVQAGEFYVLMVDDFTRTGAGFNLDAPTINGNPATNCAILLPLEFAAFEGEARENNNMLTWTSALETTDGTFYLERSLDGRKFETIYSINAKGEPSTYQYLDNNAPERAYYRVLAQEIEGDQKYTRIISLSRYGYSSQDSYFSVYPNPTSSSTVHLKYELQNASEVSIVVYDLLGNRLSQKQFYSEGGKNETDIHLPANLPKGMYIVDFKSMEGNQRTKFIKE